MCTDPIPTAPAGIDWVCTPITTVQEEATAGRDAAALAEGTAVVDVLREVRGLFKYLRPVLTKGEVVAPFCLGATCNATAPDAAKTIAGTALARLSDTCDALEAHVSVDTLPLSNLIYTATGDIAAFDSAALQEAVDMLSGFGLQEVNMTLSVGTAGFSLAGSGKALLAGLQGGGGGLLGDVVTALAGALEDVRLFVNVSVLTGGKASLLFEVSLLEPDTAPKGVAVVNAAGTKGLSVFFLAESTVISGASTSVGVSLPLKVCVENCSPVTAAGSRFIHFTGTALARQLTAALEVQGVLTMAGTWNNALGLSFLHISDARLGLGATVAPTLAFPTSITIGVCAWGWQGPM